MPGRKRKIDRWVSVAQALNVQREADVPEKYLVSKDNPEKTAIQKDLFSRLSVEAQHVVHLILDSPLEIFEIIGAPKGRSYQRKIVRFLRSEEGFTTVKARRVVKELQTFVKEF